MKFLVDECVEIDIVYWLRKSKYFVIAAHEDMCGFDDQRILNKALQANLILITCDKDFGDLVFKQDKNHSGKLNYINLKIKLS